MKIGILGTGNVGRALGKQWILAGRDVRFGSREPGAARQATLEASLGVPVHLVSNATCAREADVLVLAAPWPEGLDLVRLIGDQRRIVIDCMNPLNQDLSGLTVPADSSTAEEIAKQFSQLRVVKAFNSASAGVMADPDFQEHPPTMLYCGDDEDAKRTVAGLIQEIGFDPIDAGPLKLAGHLESLALLTIKLAIKNRWGGDCALRIMRRGKSN